MVGLFQSSSSALSAHQHRCKGKAGGETLSIQSPLLRARHAWFIWAVTL